MVFFIEKSLLRVDGTEKRSMATGMVDFVELWTGLRKTGTLRDTSYVVLVRKKGIVGSVL